MGDWTLPTEAQVVFLVGMDDDPHNLMAYAPQPAAFLPVCGKPALAHTIAIYSAYGFTSFHVVCQKSAHEDVCEQLRNLKVDQHLDSLHIAAYSHPEASTSVQALVKMMKEGILTGENIIVIQSSCISAVAPSLYLRHHRCSNATMTVVLSDLRMDTPHNEKLSKCKRGCVTLIEDSVTTPTKSALEYRIQESQTGVGERPKKHTGLAFQLDRSCSESELGVPEDTFQMPTAMELHELDQVLGTTYGPEGLKGLECSAFPCFTGLLTFYHTLDRGLISDQEDKLLTLPFSAIRSTARLRAFTQLPCIVVLARELIPYLEGISSLDSVFFDLIPFLVEQQLLPPAARHPRVAEYLKSTPELYEAPAPQRYEFERILSADELGQQPRARLRQTSGYMDDGGSFRAMGGSPGSSLAYPSIIDDDGGRPSAMGSAYMKRLFMKLESRSADEAKKYIDTLALLKEFNEPLIETTLEASLKPPRKLIVEAFEITNQPRENHRARDFPAIHGFIDSTDTYRFICLRVKDGILCNLHLSTEHEKQLERQQRKNRKPSKLDEGADVVSSLVQFECKIGMAKITDCVLGEGCTIGDGCVIKDCVLGRFVQVHPKSTLIDCVVYDNVTIGEGCNLQNCVVMSHHHVPAETTAEDQNIG
ncbi:Translation initiation factor [Giardia muris]|uniref:Translation initiation factor eIF2B subunit gamma n=1 Tax=Giardia muris TaxID=5742 RepID=A0A4Z1SND8_GIAMU|nr:Translation initiation factor [Giardia muris]|eukprot:TNJ27256.1 Translation initiation factor [Giardia muris]